MNQGTEISRYRLSQFFDVCDGTGSAILCNLYGLDNFIIFAVFVENSGFIEERLCGFKVNSYRWEC